ncbi:hypothetical protein BH10PSE17_BH10PSE17_34810 [soil metagenome]
MRTLITARRLALMMTLLAITGAYASLQSPQLIWIPVAASSMALLCWTRFKRVRTSYLDDRKWFQGVIAED